MIYIHRFHFPLPHFFFLSSAFNSLVLSCLYRYIDPPNPKKKKNLYCPWNRLVSDVRPSAPSEASLRLQNWNSRPRRRRRRRKPWTKQIKERKKERKKKERIKCKKSFLINEKKKKQTKDPPKKQKNKQKN